MKAFVGNDLIVAVGFLWGDATTASAAENPNQKYAIIDSVVNTPEQGSTTHAARTCARWSSPSNEGSFLVGAAAACASTSGKLGFIGGVENDLIKKFEAGFTAGAKAGQPGRHGRGQVHHPAARTSPASTTRPRARPSPTPMYDSGIDVVYAAAGGSGKGLFEAAKETGQEAGRDLRHRRRLRPVPRGRRPTCSPTSSPRR